MCRSHDTLTRDLLFIILQCNIYPFNPNKLLITHHHRLIPDNC